MGGASVKDCPQEVLLEIVKTLYDDKTKKDSYNLCLVKPFNPAATELLYYSCDFVGASSFLLLRTVLHRPDLGALIRQIHLYASGTYLVPNSETRRYICDQFSEAIRKLGLSLGDRSRWIQRLNETPSYALENSELLGTLLLLHTPNIVSMYINWNAKWAPFGFESYDAQLSMPIPDLWKVIFPHMDCAFAPLAFPHYGNLRSITLLAEISIKQVTRLFTMESLEHVSISGVHERLRLLEYEESLSEDSSNIKSLKLFSLKFDQNVLIWMIRACKALRQLYCGSAWLHNHFSAADYGRLSQELQKHKASLRSLKIINLCSTLNTFGDWTPFTELESFWIDVERLRYSHPASMATDLVFTLPSNLKQLRIGQMGDMGTEENGLLIYRYQSEVWTSLWDLKSISLPRLERLNVGIFDIDEDQRHDLESGELAQTLGDRGVVVRFQNQHKDFSDHWDD